MKENMVEVLLLVNRNQEVFKVIMKPTPEEKNKYMQYSICSNWEADRVTDLTKFYAFKEDCKWELR